LREERIRSDRFRRVDELFASALEREGDARRRFLDESCADDAPLRQEVETMLQMAKASEEFLETPAFNVAAALLGDETQRLERDSTPAHTPVTTGAIDNARFIPGDLVAGRYRIVGLLGRGGMGEVYRADDLRLSQPVALKFLAESLARDGAALARFHREVSVARQISHRHVCRVYDIGEHAGMQFLSMEYIRGEELSSLLKRIGRLPHDKAIDVARQLCAGLAAIHDAGVLHRDLKPANVMLDEHGAVRITDFGIVALAEGVSGREAMIGTPAYMSPEQLTGGELTTRSDVYSLGLVMYEFFTGKRRTASSSATAPELDPVVARVIERCLETDPGKRPASALQVSAALPGGDPLAAALAAGETPSPQMVAAAPKQGSLSPGKATLLLAWIVVAVILAALISGWTSLHRLVPLERSPELLQETATGIARTAGYTAAADSDWGFYRDSEALTYIFEKESGPRLAERLRTAQPPAILYWYRQSPQHLVALDFWTINPSNPPLTTSGMTVVALDTKGRLLYFEGVPPQVDQRGSTTADWAPFFGAAGLDAATFRSIQSQWTPPQHSDARMAWSGRSRERPDVPLRVEAASYRGKPTYFEVIGPWRHPMRQETPEPASGLPSLLLVLYFGALALGALLAWRNLRLGRGDRRGAFRLALLTFALRMFMWLVVAHHVPSFGEVMAFIVAVQSALYWSCTIGLLHLALEPFVRRRWPEWIISWSRLLAGDVRDPLVGRDVLIGCAFGGAMVIADELTSLLPQLLGQPMRPTIHSPRLYEHGLLGARGFVVNFVNELSAAMLFSFIIISLVLFFVMLTRNRKIAFGITWVLFYLVAALQTGIASPFDWLLAAITPTLLLLVLTRYGVLTLVTMMFFVHLTVFFPVTTDLTAWYATAFILELIALAAVALYGFRTSLAGQKLVGAGLFDE
jgi:serine/threonine protein kinase